MDFKLRTNALYANNKELILDLKKVSKLLQKKEITRNEYDKKGKYHSATYMRRFGGWNNALKKAGLEIGLIRTITEKELFENIEIVWRILGRQPFVAEMKKPLSRYNYITYQRRFGSWITACEAFIKYKQKDVDFTKWVKVKSINKSRTINEKTRLKVLKKDHYRCVKCGRSPASERGIILHIDHIKPFSKGGDSSIENLQTLCSKCNLGKNNDENL
ncbi:MAG: HNH endonuclease [Patescibacteria group bacterium]